MSTIAATLEPDVDGTPHLPLPPEMHTGKLTVSATAEPVERPKESRDGLRVERRLKGFGCLKGKLWMAPDFDEPLQDFKEYME